ncbi:hypothetical protein P7M41_26255, partial [Vibrio parahaemolyticus]|nr:hypothetical protein [Vibrio parahaemolyticus]
CSGASGQSIRQEEDIIGANFSVAGKPMAAVFDRNTLTLLSVSVTPVQPTIGGIRLSFLLLVEICRLLAQRAE